MPVAVGAVLHRNQPEAQVVMAAVVMEHLLVLVAPVRQTLVVVAVEHPLVGQQAATAVPVS
jgi:hypothetical protein